MAKNLILVFLERRFIVNFLILFCFTVFSPGESACHGQEARAAQNRKMSNESDRVSILFLGDTSFGEHNPETLELLREKGYDYPLQRVAPLLAGSDLVVANLETPITDIPLSPLEGRKTLIHWTDVKQAPKFFQKYNLTAFSLANNHSFDYGIAGLKQTLQIMSENNLQAFGAGLNEKEASQPFEKEFMVGDKPITIVVIGAFEYFMSYVRLFDFYTEKSKAGVLGLEPRRLAAQIRSIKKDNPDAYIIIFPHWGDNYSWKSDRQTKYAHTLIEAGADLIIGHGGHAMQEIEKYQGRWIIYGLGNFIFLNKGSYGAKNWFPYSFGAQLIIADQKGNLEKHLRLYPLNSDNLQTDYQPRPLSPEEFKRFQELLLSRSPLASRQLSEISHGQDTYGSYLQFMID